MLKLFVVSEKQRHVNPMRGYWCESYVCIAENEAEALYMHPYLTGDRLHSEMFLIICVAGIVNGNKGLVSKNYLYDKR